MQKKPTIIASIILSSVLLAGIAAIIALRLPLASEQKTTEVQEAQVTPADTLSLKEHLKQSLEVKQSKFNKKKKREIWLLGQGRSIIQYLLEAQKMVQERGGKILSMEEIFYDRSSLASSVFQAATLSFLDLLHDTSHVELQISKKLFISGGSSKIAIVFQGENLHKQMDFLNGLEYPHSVLITPWKLPPEILGQLRSSKNRELVLWLYMESSKLRSITAPRPIRFHLTENDIQKIILDANALIPEAKGIASRFGEQAVEHSHLMNATLRPLQELSLYFLDLTGINSSLTKKVCSELELRCDSPDAYNADNSLPEDYIRKKIAEAAKNGTAIMILPLNNKIQKELENIQERLQKQGTEITTLESLVELRQ